jgi:single-strand DNA-binding protein
MAGLNKIMLIGRLGKDPETRNLDGGRSVVTVSLATSEKYKDKSNGQLKEITDWHNLVLWNQVGSIVARYTKKGSQIYVEGKSRTRSWEKDGITRYTTEVIVDTVQLLDSKPAGQNQSDEISKPQRQGDIAPAFGSSPDPGLTDDLPF